MERYIERGERMNQKDKDDVRASFKRVYDALYDAHFMPRRAAAQQIVIELKRLEIE